LCLQPRIDRGVGPSDIRRYLKECIMPEIRQNNDLVTYITTINVDPHNQVELLNLMTKRARFMATQPGFVSISLHRSQDSRHVVNYVQWEDRERLEAAHRAPAFRETAALFGRLIADVEADFYEPVLVESK
jgi:quinol monooxygenase YgiN